jgi:RHS repeat-associated protein
VDSFGMLVPNRHGSSNSYRYGFQGQEKDDEIKGEGNSLNYTFRMHDPRVGRFFTKDPLEAEYPWYTPYQFSGNKVIEFVELEGLEESPSKSNSSKKKEPGFFEESLLKAFNGWVDIFSTISKVTGNAKYKNDTFEHKVGNLQGGYKGLLDTTFELYGMNQLARHGIGGVDDEISYKFNFSFSKSIGSSFKNFNSRMATKYLSSTGQLANFETVEGFEFSIGNLRYMYSNSLESSKRGNWWTSQKYQSSLEAFDYLALDYNGTKNFAQNMFSVRVFGLSVKGTAAGQNTTMGTGIQYMGVKLNNIIPTKSGGFRLSGKFQLTPKKYEGLKPSF